MKKNRIKSIAVTSLTYLAIGMLMVALAPFQSCTDQEKARNYGGNETLELKPNEKLINITWKGDDLWLLTQDTITNKKYFRERSSWGLFEGQIEIKEPKTSSFQYIK